MTSTDLADQDIVGFDTDEGPYAFYSRIREEAPVFWSERLQRWILTRYDDVFAAYRNTQAFSSQTFGSRGAGTALDDPAQDRVVDTFKKQILFLDRPEHTRLRRLVSSAFTPRSVEEMRGYTASLATSMLDELQGSDFDFVRRFAGPLPLSVVSEIFGVDVEDRDLYRAWSDSLALITSPNQPADALRAAFQHVDEMRAYLADMVVARRSSPRADLLSRMIEVEDGGDRLSTDEIVAMAMIITAAGHETTTSLLVNSLRLCSTTPSAPRGSVPMMPSARVRWRRRFGGSRRCSSTPELRRRTSSCTGRSSPRVRRWRWRPPEPTGTRASSHRPSSSIRKGRQTRT